MGRHGCDCYHQPLAVARPARPRGPPIHSSNGLLAAPRVWVCVQLKDVSNVRVDSDRGSGATSVVCQCATIENWYTTTTHVCVCVCVCTLCVCVHTHTHRHTHSNRCCTWSWYDYVRDLNTSGWCRCVCRRRPARTSTRALSFLQSILAISQQVWQTQPAMRCVVHYLYLNCALTNVSWRRGSKSWVWACPTWQRVAQSTP